MPVPGSRSRPCVNSNMIYHVYTDDTRDPWVECLGKVQLLSVSDWGS